MNANKRVGTFHGLSGKLLFFAIFLAANALLAAEKPAPSPAAAARQKKFPKCCVWRVTNAKAPFYLVGSMHSLSKTDYPLPSPYDLALNDCHRLVFEYDPNKDDEFQKKFSEAGRYPDGQDIRSRIHPKTLAWLRNNTQFISWNYNEKEKQYHASLKGFDAALQYRPWWIADHFFDIRSYSDVSDKDGVDFYFEKRGRKAGKELGGLETVDEHVAVLGKLSDRDGEILLLDTLVYMDTAANEYHRMRSAWRRGDMDKLWVLDSRLRREAPWIASRLVDIRNVMWLPRIEREIHSGKPTTIVAGALHFAGPNSVIALLQKQGYTIEQL
jgi:uncharacterized protein YbaP (TraB family)